MSGKKINPPKNQIFANRYLKDNTGSNETKMFNVNRTNCKSNKISIGFERCLEMLVRLFMKSIIHSPVDRISIGSDGADKLKLPKKKSIEMGNEAIRK